MKNGAYRIAFLLVTCALALATACGDDGGNGSPVDTVGPGPDTTADVPAIPDTTEDAVTPDTGPLDTAPPDTGPADTGPADTGPADTGPADTGPTDTGGPDAAPADTGPTDTGGPDAAPADTGPADTAAPDAGGPDTAGEDVAAPDAGPGDTGGPDVAGPEPAIAAADQTLALSLQVAVASARSEGPGWATIHESNGAGSFGAPIGHAALPDGDAADVLVTLIRPAEDGETLYAMLHIDAGEVGTYEFPGADTPALTSGGDMVVTPFVVSVAAGTPAARIRIGSVGFESYTFPEVEPPGLGLVGPGTEDNPLTLPIGWRYELDNTVTAFHPFELLTVGAGPADTVLLSQYEVGTFEAVPEVAWSEDGDIAQFTLTDALAAALTGYRCAFHPVAMRGTVTPVTSN